MNPPDADTQQRPDARPRSRSRSREYRPSIREYMRGSIRNNSHNRSGRSAPLPGSTLKKQQLPSSKMVDSKSSSQSPRSRSRSVEEGRLMKKHHMEESNGDGIGESGIVHSDQEVKKTPTEDPSVNHSPTRPSTSQENHQILSAEEQHNISGEQNIKSSQKSFQKPSQKASPKSDSNSDRKGDATMILEDIDQLRAELGDVLISAEDMCDGEVDTEPFQLLVDADQQLMAALALSLKARASGVSSVGGKKIKQTGGDSHKSDNGLVVEKPPRPSKMNLSSKKRSGGSPRDSNLLQHSSSGKSVRGPKSMLNDLSIASRAEQNRVVESFLSGQASDRKPNANKKIISSHDVSRDASRDQSRDPSRGRGTATPGSIGAFSANSRANLLSRRRRPKSTNGVFKRPKGVGFFADSHFLSPRNQHCKMQDLILRTNSMMGDVVKRKGVVSPCRVGKKFKDLLGGDEEAGGERQGGMNMGESVTAYPSSRGSSIERKWGLGPVAGLNVGGVSLGSQFGLGSLPGSGRVSLGGNSVLGGNLGVNSGNSVLGSGLGTMMNSMGGKNVKTNLGLPERSPNESLGTLSTGPGPTPDDEFYSTTGPRSSPPNFSPQPRSSPGSIPFSGPGPGVHGLTNNAPHTLSNLVLPPPTLITTGGNRNLIESKNQDEEADRIVEDFLIASVGGGSPISPTARLLQKKSGPNNRPSGSFDLVEGTKLPPAPVQNLLRTSPRRLAVKAFGNEDVVEIPAEVQADYQAISVPGRVGFGQMMNQQQMQQHMQQQAQQEQMREQKTIIGMEYAETLPIGRDVEILPAPILQEPNLPQKLPSPSSTSNSNPAKEHLHKLALRLEELDRKNLLLHKSQQQMLIDLQQSVMTGLVDEVQEHRASLSARGSPPSGKVKSSPLSRNSQAGDHVHVVVGDAMVSGASGNVSIGGSGGATALEIAFPDGYSKSDISDGDITRKASGDRTTNSVLGESGGQSGRVNTGFPGFRGQDNNIGGNQVQQTDESLLVPNTPQVQGSLSDKIAELAALVQRSDGRVQTSQIAGTKPTSVPNAGSTITNSGTTDKTEESALKKSPLSKDVDVTAMFRPASRSASAGRFGGRSSPIVAPPLVAPRVPALDKAIYLNGSANAGVSGPGGANIAKSRSQNTSFNPFIPPGLLSVNKNVRGQAPSPAPAASATKPKQDPSTPSHSDASAPRPKTSLATDPPPPPILQKTPDLKTGTASSGIKTLEVPGFRQTQASGVQSAKTPPANWFYPKGPVKATAPVQLMSGSTPPVPIGISLSPTIPPAAAAVPVRKPGTTTGSTESVANKNRTLSESQTQSLFAPHESNAAWQERGWREKLRPEGLQLPTQTQRSLTPVPSRAGAAQRAGSLGPSLGGMGGVGVVGGVVSMRPSVSWSTPGARSSTPVVIRRQYATPDVVRNESGLGDRESGADGGMRLGEILSRADGQHGQDVQHEFPTKRLSRSPASPVLPPAEEPLPERDLSPPKETKDKELVKSNSNTGSIQKERSRSPISNVKRSSRKEDTSTANNNDNTKPQTRKSSRSSSIPRKPLIKPPPSLARPGSVGNLPSASAGGAARPATPTTNAPSGIATNTAGGKSTPNHLQPTLSSARKAAYSTSLRSLSEFSNASSKSPTRMEFREQRPEQGTETRSARSRNGSAHHQSQSGASPGAVLNNSTLNNSTLNNQSVSVTTGPGIVRSSSSKRIIDKKSAPTSPANGAARHLRACSLPRNKFKIWNPADGRGCVTGHIGGTNGTNGGGNTSLSPKVVSPSSVLSPTRILRSPALIPVLPTMIPGPATTWQSVSTRGDGVQSSVAGAVDAGDQHGQVVVEPEMREKSIENNVVVEASGVGNDQLTASGRFNWDELEAGLGGVSTGSIIPPPDPAGDRRVINKQNPVNDGFNDGRPSPHDNVSPESSHIVSNTTQGHTGHIMGMVSAPVQHGGNIHAGIPNINITSAPLPNDLVLAHMSGTVVGTPWTTQTVSPLDVLEVTTNLDEPRAIGGGAGSLSPPMGMAHTGMAGGQHLAPRVVPVPEREITENARDFTTVYTDAEIARAKSGYGHGQMGRK